MKLGGHCIQFPGAGPVHVVQVGSQGWQTSAASGYVPSVQTGPHDPSGRKNVPGGQFVQPIDPGTLQLLQLVSQGRQV